MDPNKLIDLVVELDRQLAERDNMSARHSGSKAPNTTWQSRVSFARNELVAVKANVDRHEGGRLGDYKGQYRHD